MAAIRGVPHPFPYQGSKRQLASQIVACIPRETNRLIEPFVGSGAVTLATAFLRRSCRFVISDIHEPLIRLWESIIYNPDKLADQYEELWRRQMGRQREFYDEVRASFNQKHEPHCFLYLLARCVKAAIRYNAYGHFNNSPDNRRLGMRPETMRRNLLCASQLIRDRVDVRCQGYRDTLETACSDDVIYMDPPYQGVSDSRDQRYCDGVDYGEFIEDLEDLNRRSVPFLVSYDGRTGAKVHGESLPEHLGLVHLELEVGRSTQATLLGRADSTIESLYLSPALLMRIGQVPEALRPISTASLFAEV